MNIQKEIVRIASQELGVKEVGGNNLGPRVNLYQTATWLKPGAWPWCAAFCAWVLNEALKTESGKAYLEEKGVAHSAFRCRDASAFGWLAWAKKQRLTVFDEDATISPRPGDFVVFDFSHIGVVIGTKWDDVARRTTHVLTVEGNTNGRGDRDSATGDGVWGKTRDTALVRAYIRLS